MKTQFTCLILLWISISVAVAQDSIPVAECEVPKGYAELDVNNVRARILAGSDMWWDLEGTPKYEIPAGSGKNCGFVGDFWLGGKDANDQIYVMAQLYRQSRVASYPGPLKATGAQSGATSAEVCREYDHIYKINKSRVEEFRNWYACSQNPDCNTEENFPGYTIPDIILNWPAHGPQGGYAYYLAPFWDANNDGEYNPYDGDFPYFEFPEDSVTDNFDCIDTKTKDPKLYGDQCLWNVFNDAGNYTGSPSMGMEIHKQAFAFESEGLLNNQTFYHYRVINRSTNTYDEFWFSMFIDSDLGDYQDDYIGCDVSRGLGYTYNGDNYDESNEYSTGYGQNPPAFGVDILAGPYQDSDGQDNESNWVESNGTMELDCGVADFMNGNINGRNFGDGIVDNERWGMTSFTEERNIPGPLSGPYTTSEFYRMMTGKWPRWWDVYYGGNGFPGGDSDVVTVFMYPGDPTTDPCGWGQDGQVMDGWSELSESNTPGDRRNILSSGPVTMAPGAVNDITYAALYARDINANAWENVEALQRVSDAVQSEFDRCFRSLNGIDPPQLDIIELDSKLVFHIQNPPTSNNYLESYTEKDHLLQCEDCDAWYRFQGYQVYQLKDENVNFQEDRYDTTRVKCVFQCDIRDDVKNLVNYYYNPETGSLTDRLEVRADNKGISHSFELTTDAFPWGDSDALVNHKTMYFVAVAYATNTDCLYSPFDEDSFHCQRQPYQGSVYDVNVYQATAHKPEPVSHGTSLHSDYGAGLEISQIAGFGNGNNIIELSGESLDTIMAAYPWKDDTPDYEPGYTPVDIKVMDPLSLVADRYKLFFRDTASQYFGKIYEGCDWVLVNSEGDSIWSDKGISYNQNEQLIPELGLSVSIEQVEPAAFKNWNQYQNGFLEADITSENQNSWLTFLPDGDNDDYYNWIRSGEYSDHALQDPNTNYDDVWGADPDEFYESILGGTWAPAYLTSDFKYGPVYDRTQMSPDKFSTLSSVDVVITPDKSKWSRCAVLEMNENNWTLDENGYETEVTPLTNDDSEGNALRFDLRTAASVDKDGNPDGSGTHGMGWFPGYAIDVRTGERLNIIFGEDSGLPAHNGNDMLWNPTSGVEEDGEIIFGGKHYIWVMGHTNYVLYPEMSAPAYDSCQFIYDKMIEYENTDEDDMKRHALTGMMWTAIPYLQEGGELLSSDIRIRLRTGSPYFRGVGEFADPDSVNNNYPAYRFSTEGLVPEFDQPEVAESALDLIRVVPNPYYGHSYYESSDTRRVKITNLPESCTVSIFDVSGHLVRRFDKTGGNPWLEWDLTDRYGKPISSGMYIVHINAPGIGEKVVKWFGALSEQ
ncbi:MAG: T9SS type A sorting domain-containing protein [Bacteroidales bacterium]